MRVLVVEDEEVMAEVVSLGLRREGMAVDVALGGQDALDKAMVNAYDVVVLDRTFPECTATMCAGPSSTGVAASAS